MKSDKKHLNLNIEPELHKALKVEAAMQDMSLTSYVLKIILNRPEQLSEEVKLTSATR